MTFQSKDPTRPLSRMLWPSTLLEFHTRRRGCEFLIILSLFIILYLLLYINMQLNMQGNKTELIIPPAEASKYKGLENQEGNWILISRVEVKPAFSGFKHVNCPFILTVVEGTRIYPISQQNDRHYIEFKSIHEIKHISNIDVPIDVMGVLFNVEPLEVCSSDHQMSSITFYIKDNLDNQIKCIAYGDTAYRFRDVNASNVGTGVVILVLTMWRVCKWREEEPWIKSHNGLSDFRFNPWMTEVDEFRRQLAL